MTNSDLFASPCSKSDGTMEHVLIVFIKLFRRSFIKNKIFHLDFNGVLICSIEANRLCAVHVNRFPFKLINPVFTR